MELLSSLKEEHEASAGSRSASVRGATRVPLHGAISVLCGEGSALHALRLGR